MTVAQIKANGTLIQKEEVRFTFTRREYWKVENTMYVINNDKITYAYQMA